MKKLIVLIAITLISAPSKGQALTGFANIVNSSPNMVTADWVGLSGGFPANVEVISTYNTTVLNKGNKDCDHKWAVKIKEISMISCAVMHGAEGCSNNWKNDLRICTECLRHEQITETRTTKTKADKYQEALNKLKNK